MEKKRKSEAPSYLSLNRLSNAFHHSTDAIVLTDKAGVIKDINPAFSNMYGYTPEEVIGKNNRILRSSDTNASVHTDMWE